MVYIKPNGSSCLKMSAIIDLPIVFLKSREKWSAIPACLMWSGFIPASFLLCVLERSEPFHFTITCQISFLLMLSVRWNTVLIISDGVKEFYGKEHVANCILDKIPRQGAHGIDVALDYRYLTVPGNLCYGFSPFSHCTYKLSGP